MSSQMSTPTSNIFHRTIMCKFHLMGSCTRGRACTFAHGSRDLRQKPDLFCTQLCKDYMRTGRCANKDECRFAHGHAELRCAMQTKPSATVNQKAVESLQGMGAHGTEWPRIETQPSAPPGAKTRGRSNSTLGMPVIQIPEGDWNLLPVEDQVAQLRAEALIAQHRLEMAEHAMSSMQEENQSATTRKKLRNRRVRVHRKRGKDRAVVSDQAACECNSEEDSSSSGVPAEQAGHCSATSFSDCGTSSTGATNEGLDEDLGVMTLMKDSTPKEEDEVLQVKNTFLHVGPRRRCRALAERFQTN